MSGAFGEPIAVCSFALYGSLTNVDSVSSASPVSLKRSTASCWTPLIPSFCNVHSWSSDADPPPVPPSSCGPEEPQDDGGTGGGSASELQLWTLQNEGINGVQQEAVDRFNETGDAELTLSTFVNDPYKAKLQTAIGSPNAPDIFYNWGCLLYTS